MRHGFLLIDKPAGVTSHDVVADVRRTLSETHVGHLGTLDPAATGLLVLAVGSKALKVVELFNSLPKEYDADVLFGAVSTTYDGDGVMEKIDPPKGWEIPEQAVLQRTIADRFVGRFKQVPPAYSAVHIGGERAYRKAQQGRGVNIPPREVEIKECKILSYDYPRLSLHVACGSGTYIRSLANDLGQLLHCGAYLKGLRRTKVGAWSVADAAAKAVWARVLPLKDVLLDLPRKELTKEEFTHLSFGRNIPGNVEMNEIGWFDSLPVALLEPAGSNEIHARKIL